MAIGTLIAAIIIIALIFYALKDLVADKDFSAWTNIALTSLILFTVILSIFMILHKPADNYAARPSGAVREGESAPQKPALSPEEEEEAAKEGLASEYVIIEDDCKKNMPGTDCAQYTADFLIKQYNFTKEEWSAFMQTAAENNLFEQARARQKVSK